MYTQIELLYRQTHAWNCLCTRPNYTDLATKVLLQDTTFVHDDGRPMRSQVDYYKAYYFLNVSKLEKLTSRARRDLSNGIETQNQK